MEKIIKESVIQNIETLKPETRKNASTQIKQDKWVLIVIFSVTGGFALGLIGLIMSGLAYFGFTENAKEINRIGTWLIVAAFPLIIFGAHALDKIAATEKQKKIKDKF